MTAEDEYLDYPVPSLRSTNHQATGSEDILFRPVPNQVDETPHPSAEEEVADELDLKYGSRHVIKLIVPVSVCMFFVVVTINSISYFTEDSGVTLIYAPFHEDSDSSATLLWTALANAGIFLVFVAVMTVLLIIAYKYSFYKFIHCWMFLSTLLMLFVFAFVYLSEVIRNYNIPMDYITITMVMWNFGILGLLAIHWRSPILLNQAYLVVISALMALVFIKYLPTWTTWTVLGVISLWDLFAVLAPYGPLRILVETAHDRNEQIFPALIYQAGILYQMITATTTEGDSEIQPEPANGQEEDEGIKLGLGDFIFYSILVGKASTSGDWNATLACFVAILVGLVCTLSILALYRKALPALPFSIAFGILFYFVTREIVTPFTNVLSSQQVFI